MDAKPVGYEIKNAKVPILLGLKRIGDLKPHEETVRESLKGLVSLLRRDPVLRHPVMVDENTGLVLDGMHRLAALIELGCKLAPCALVDYRDSRIRVERWFRKIEGASLADFRTKLARMQPLPAKFSEAEHCLSTRACYASLEDHESCFMFSASSRDPVDLAHSGFEIERAARDSQLRVSYEDTKSIDYSNGFVLSTISVDKPEILEASTQHRVFPPKTTRHIIPSRPLGVQVSLALLQESDLPEAERKLLKHLQSKRLAHRPEGSWVGSRRYQEEVFVFE